MQNHTQTKDFEFREKFLFAYHNIKLWLHIKCITTTTTIQFATFVLRLLPSNKDDCLEIYAVCFQYLLPSVYK